jgi:hypothetical protein
MPLISGLELGRVIELLENRGVHFFHACQLKDLRTYLDLGGIPSRHAMQEAGRPFTQFDSDQADQASGSWSKVFGNLSDFGWGFARGNNTSAVPNPYGPILLVFDPHALESVDDLAICLRSAGIQGFNRTAESLASAAEVDRIFTNTYDPDETYTNAYLKRSEELRAEFGARVGTAASAGWRTLNPEVSCTVSDELIGFEHLIYVIVDSYTKDGTRLIDLVSAALNEHAVNTRVLARNYRVGANRERILQDLLRSFDNGPISLQQFAGKSYLAPESREWADRVRSRNLGWQFDRYARYLYEGTLSEMGG